jgi:hypothetical protein
MFCFFGAHAWIYTGTGNTRVCQHCLKGQHLEYAREKDGGVWWWWQSNG